jgi:hypothetical protein
VRNSPLEKAADVWVTLLFLPVLPLGKWVVERRGEQEPTWALRSVQRPALLDAVATVVAFYAVAVLVFVPGFAGVAYFVGNQLLSLAGLFASLGLIIGLMGWLDSTRSRVPLRDVIRSLVGPKEQRLVTNRGEVQQADAADEAP